MTTRDPKEDQVAATRRLLEQMCPTASKAIGGATSAKVDAVVAASTPMSPRQR